MPKAAPPPFTDFPTPLYVGVDHAATPATEPTEEGWQWWRLATRIANEVIDATTLEEIDAVRRRNEADIKALIAARRDLALTLSWIFAEHRKALGGGASTVADDV